MNSFSHCSSVLFCVLAILTSFSTPFASAQGLPADTTTQTSETPVPPKSPAATDDDWHFGVTPYVWFAGVHGTSGALGHQISVHASFSDIFQNFNVGLMGTVEARKKRFVTATDFMWMRLSDDKGLPLNELGIQSADVKIRQFLLTPMAGYRVVDKTIKVDAMVGFRFWHLGEEINFTPSLVGGVSTSQNWADALGGARIQIPLSQKALITIVGDAGGGGANSDYEVAGLLGYRLGKKCILQGGWRYLDANYRGNNNFIYDIATSGVLIGVTINLK